MHEKIKVSEIMSNKPIFINADETVQKAAMLMRKNNISGLIVVIQNNVVAVVTIKDIAMKIVAENQSPIGKKVKDIMSSKLITAQSDEIISEIAMRMATNDISRIPVMDKDNNLLGIVTKTDILKVIPGLFDIFYEKEKEIIPISERENIDGICEECGNHSDELKNVDGRWLCEECAELKNLR